MTVAILAGTHKEYRHWLKGRQETEFRYISSAEKARGMFFDSLEIVGTFWERKDAGELYDNVIWSIRKEHE